MCLYIPFFPALGIEEDYVAMQDLPDPVLECLTMSRAPGQRTEINFHFVKPLRVEGCLLLSHNAACFDLCTMALGNKAFPAFSYPRRTFFKLGPNYDLRNT